MKGNFNDLLQLAAKDKTVAKELVDLASRHGMELTDEIDDKDLEKIFGGVAKKKKPAKK